MPLISRACRSDDQPSPPDKVLTEFGEMEGETSAKTTLGEATDKLKSIGEAIMNFSSSQDASGNGEVETAMDKATTLAAVDPEVNGTIGRLSRYPAVG